LAGIVALLSSSCGTRADRDAFYESLRRNQTGTQQDVTASVGEDVTSDVPDASDTSARATEVLGTQQTPTKTKTTKPSGGVPANVSREVIGKQIDIGIHVPITGAAPIPTDFLDYMRVIETYVAEEAPIHGRTFRFVETDDGYDPAKGQAACRKLASENIVLAVGHTMPAVEDGCADLFGGKGIPYLMRGTYPSVLKDRPLAYFGTISDDRQGAMLADYAIGKLGAGSKKTAVVFQNDQTAARDTFVKQIASKGGKIVATEQSVPRQSDYAATVQKLQQAGAQIVFLSMPPVDAIKLSVQAQGAGYHPTYLGGGTYWNYNLTLESAGMALDGAIAFSPWASIDSSAANEFKAIYRRYRPNKQPEDIGLIIWGWYSMIRAVLEKAGPDISRATVVDALNHLDFSAPYWNPVRYTDGDHNGARSVAVLRADGQAKRWRQITGFTSRF
jgi:branched-chain amino acid transport system substrate-binding protein